MLFSTISQYSSEQLTLASLRTPFMQNRKYFCSCAIDLKRSDPLGIALVQISFEHVQSAFYFCSSYDAVFPSDQMQGNSFLISCLWVQITCNQGHLPSKQVQSLQQNWLIYFSWSPRSKSCDHVMVNMAHFLWPQVTWPWPWAQGKIHEKLRFFLD